MSKAEKPLFYRLFCISFIDTTASPNLSILIIRGSKRPLKYLNRLEMRIKGGGYIEISDGTHRSESSDVPP